MSQIYALAQNIHRDEFEADDTIVSSRVISGWLANNIGSLNALLNTEFSGDSPDWDLEAQAVYHELYLAHYYGKKARNAMNGVIDTTSAGSNIISFKDGDSEVRFVNSKEVGKELTRMGRQHRADAVEMAHRYTLHQSTPRQVAGVDGDWLSGTI